MTYRFLQRAAALAAVLIGLGAGGCSSPTAPDDVDDVQIVLAVSGGIAGSDWQVTIDGRTGEIVGDRCRDHFNCDWEPGETLAAVDEAALEGLAGEFFERGFFEGPSDFGTECCDQFDYTLTYEDADDRRTVHGSDGTLPGHIQSLVMLVRQFVENARAGI